MKLNDLVVSECNVRQPRDEDDLESLTESIKSESLISKLVLRACPEPGKYEVVAGQRRFRAMVDAFGAEHDLDESDYVLKMNLSDDDAFILSLEENQQRLNLSPLELARAAVKLNQMGRNDKEVAKKLNITSARLKRVQALLPEVRRMPQVAREELSKPLDQSLFTDAHWDKLKKEEDPEIVKDAVDYIVGHESPARDVPGILTGVRKKFGATGDSGPSAGGNASAVRPVDDDDSQSAEGPIVYSHKGDLTLVEQDGKMSFRVYGKGEDEEIPVEHYLEYLRHPDKFKCQVTLKLKIKPID